MRHYLGNYLNTPIAWQDKINSNSLNSFDLYNIKNAININNFEIKTNKEQDYNVFFKFDESNIGIKLSENNINRLKEFFDEDNFIFNSKGTILDKDAASFVAGWFSDIAYKRKFLEADVDGNGELSNKEGKKTLNFILERLEYRRDNKGEYIITNYVKGYEESKFLADNDEYYADISYTLNASLNNDKNLDGIITFGEFLNVGEKGYFEDNIEVSNNKNNNDFISLYKIANTDKLKEKELEELKKLAALAKLKNQGLKSLTNDEKKLLKDFNINLKISEDKLEELITNDKLSDFIDFTKEFKKDLSDTKLIDIKV
ncbi:MULTISPECIES: hypothetical protein [unclassified Campylobacter]|uniref:hypothetical protein n=1 Tax=unclassified Campylobacter TaxID=2593542 RepID=UPI001BD9E0A4|nr:hypothetical protein [Campylobacter sp. 2018MI01]MBT0878050.1 hypothetical protein [Campylobacter sp. 2018MI01]MBZ7975466.1 hypothetical protein [Campylobacter sp. RM12637]MBZ7993358.1 hypothetical protein [Campylobacter sp. RM9333]